MSYVAVLSLGLGLGGAGISISCYKAIMRPLSMREPNRLVAISLATARSTFAKVPPGFYESLQNDPSTPFEGVASIISGSRVEVDLASAGAVDRVPSAIVSPNFDHVLGLRFIQGTGLLRAENAVLISERLWHQKFEQLGEIAGKPLLINGHSYTVSGVVAAECSFPEGIDIWIPQIAPVKQLLDLGTVTNYYPAIVARLGKGVSASQAQQRTGALAGEIKEGYPDIDQDRGMAGLVTSLDRELSGGFRTVTQFVTWTSAFLLVIAGANLALILFSRAASTQQELAIRLALGASRLQAVSLILIDSAVISTLGGLLGIVLVRWGLYSATRSGILGNTLISPSFDLSTAAGIILIACSIGFFAGLFPAITSSAISTHYAFKEAILPSRSQRILRNLTLSTEIAVTLALLTGTGLMVRTIFQIVGPAQRGYTVHDAATFELDLPGTRYPNTLSQAELFRKVTDSIEMIPRVQCAGGVSLFPIGGTGLRTRVSTGDGKITVEARYSVATPHYFCAIGIVLVEGRFPGPSDLRDSEKVVILDELLARGLSPGRSSIGLTVNVFGVNRKVIGVVRSAGFRGVGLHQDVPEIYFPFSQSYLPESHLTIVVRSAPHRRIGVTEVRSALSRIDDRQTLSQWMSMEDRLAVAIAPQRQTAVLISFAGLIACLLAAIGICGVASDNVVSRRREFAVKIALGAQPMNIVLPFFREYLLWISMGILAGESLSLGIGQLMRKLLYQIQPTDPLAIFAASVGALTIALVSGYGPVRSAAFSDPAGILRYD